MTTNPVPQPGCRRCTARLAPDASFCGACGAPTPRGAHALRAVRAAQAAERALVRSGSRTLALVFVGTVAMVVLAAALERAQEWQFVAQGAGMLTIGALAARGLGPGALRASIGRRPAAAEIGLAFVVAAASLLASSAWVGLLELARRELDLAPSAVTEPSAATIVLVIVAVPVLEEWLCRGVTWLGLRRAHDRTTTILATATCFALLHGLNGNSLFELPHRFATGILLGWLRERTGGLTAPVLAHALHNGAAVWLA